ncbi:MAG: hypothetical protein CL927_20525 [Deltaproteobacteria bacterium]|nr:hypothetical protein [Deltaproteobacteria bacterium]
MRAFATPSYGPPEVLRAVERPVPTPAPDELRIVVEAVAVTRGDDRLRGGEFPGATALLGRALFGVARPRAAVQGTMFAGHVAEVGLDVTRFAVGDRVFGEVAHGAYAEQIVASETSALAHIPPHLTAAQVAAIPYGAVSAWVFLHDVAAVEAEQHVLVVGAGGGIGRYAVQIAMHLGARVTAVARPRHDATLLPLGLAESGGPHQVIRDRSALRDPADVVLDTSGSSHLNDWRPHLKPTGRFVTPDLSGRLLVDLLLCRLRSGPTVHFGMGLVTAENLSAVATLLETGAMKPIIAQQFAFDKLVEAHHCLHHDRPSGDVVVEVVPRPAGQPQARSA